MGSRDRAEYQLSPGIFDFMFCFIASWDWIGDGGNCLCAHARSGGERNLLQGVCVSFACGHAVIHVYFIGGNGHFPFPLRLN
jgi:hypothetical protein